ncbi:MAG: hypothetical protein OEW30_17545 [Acidimicrobiia bacterium]|nr:hypothetical protein [Acidimicrobiia bacterium]
MSEREDLADHVRSDERPPPDARLVLRCGPDTPSLVRSHAHRLNRLYVLHGDEVWGISVFVALDDVGPTIFADLLQTRLKGNSAVYTPTVRELVRAGFELLPTFRRPHFTVLMHSLDDAPRLHDALGELRTNPYAVD